MKKLNAEEILKIIEDNFSVREFAEGDDIYEQDEELGLGKVVEVDQYGGEGQGDTWYSVKHFVDHDVYIKTEGWYASYHGTEFEQGYGVEVKPQQKTITVFE